MPTTRNRRYDDPDPPIGTSPYPTLFPGIDWGGELYTSPAIPGPNEGGTASSLWASRNGGGGGPFSQISGIPPTSIFTRLMSSGSMAFDPLFRSLLRLGLK